MTSRSYFRAAVVALAFSAACGGDGPTTPPIELTDAQAEDMMEAFSQVGGAFGGPTGLVAKAVINFDIEETADCPMGGTYTLDGSMSFNDQTEAMTATYTQDLAGCKAESSTGRLWTFDGDPHITTSFGSSYNAANTTYTLTFTQTGAIKAASDIGTGRCAISYTMTMTSNETSGAFTANVTGTVCGRTIDADLDISEPGVGNALRVMKR